MRPLDLGEAEALLGGLGISVEKAAEREYTAEEERVMAGFEDIVRFSERTGSVPRHTGEDIFERLYAERLDRIRADDRWRALVAPLDSAGLLGKPSSSRAERAETNDEDLLAELGVSLVAENSVHTLRYVTPTTHQAPDEIADYVPCADFAAFADAFAETRAAVASGSLRSERFPVGGLIDVGTWVILGGLLGYVVAKGDSITAPNGQTNARLRVVWANGTESNHLLRSLQRALEKEETGRWLVRDALGGLFDSADDSLSLGEALTDEEGYVASGRIYVLESLSDHPYLAERRGRVFKIGRTSGQVSRRTAGAAKDATFLFAKVKEVASYGLIGLDPAKTERKLHEFFAHARLDVTAPDRFGAGVHPKEWFQVPLAVIDETMTRIQDGSIVDYYYDLASESLVRANP